MQLVFYVCMLFAVGLDIVCSILMLFWYISGNISHTFAVQIYEHLHSYAHIIVTYVFNTVYFNFSHIYNRYHFMYLLMQ